MPHAFESRQSQKLGKECPGNAREDCANQEDYVVPLGHRNFYRAVLPMKVEGCGDKTILNCRKYQKRNDPNRDGFRGNPETECRKCEPELFPAVTSLVGR